MSFDKLHKWWNRQSAIVVVYVVVMLLPNVLLAITEPYSFTTVTASLLMPGAVYLLLAVALKRPGLLMLCSFPLMVLGAFQIVLLYLFGGSIIAVDMFTNLFTTNASEAGELLGNIWPSIVFVIVLYVPLIVLAVRSLLLRDRLSAPFRRRAALGALAALILGGGMAGVSYARHPGFGIRYHIFPVNVIYNIRLSLDRWAQSNAYPETSRDFRFGVTRDSVPDAAKST